MRMCDHITPIDTNDTATVAPEGLIIAAHYAKGACLKLLAS